MGTEFSKIEMDLKCETFGCTSGTERTFKINNLRNRFEPTKFSG